LGALFGTDANRKARIFIGLAIMAGATAAVRNVDLYTAKALIATYLACWGAGAGLVIGPALLTAFENLSSEEALHSAGFFNIARSLPAYIVGSILVILLTQNTDAQFDVLRQNIRFNRAIVEQAFVQADRHFVNHPSSGGPPGKQAHAFIGKWVLANARVFALQGIFGLLSMTTAAGLALVALIHLPTSRPINPNPP
jgi:hypothetical protein